MADSAPPPDSALGKATEKALGGSTTSVAWRWGLLCLLLYVLLSPVRDALVRHLDAATQNIEKHVQKHYPTVP